MFEKPVRPLFCQKRADLEVRSTLFDLSLAECFEQPAFFGLQLHATLAEIDPPQAVGESHERFLQKNLVDQFQFASHQTKLFA